MTQLFCKHFLLQNTSGGCVCKSQQLYSNKTSPRLFFVSFVRIFWMFSFFDALQEFSKKSQKYLWKMFAKYLSAVGCFIKTIMLLTVMIMTMLSVSWHRAFTFIRHPIKRNFTWSIKAIHLCSSLSFLSQLKFWFAKKLKMKLCIQSII